MMFDKEKPFNDLPFLPPQKEIETKAVLKQLNKATRALAELKVAGRMLPNQEVLINSLVLLEAKDSSEIENIFTTHDKLYQADLLKETVKDSQTKEVQDYREALWCGAKAMKKRPLNTNVFIEIVQTIKNNQAGVRVTTGTKIKNPYGEIIYTPPEGVDLINKLLKDLEDFIHINDDYDALLKMAIIHYQFEAIHPFSDGNGRTGRILNILYLLQENLLETPVLFLSRYIIDNKTGYYKGLQNVTESQDWESWLLYMLKAVEHTAKKTSDKIEKIKAIMIFFTEKVQNDLPGIYKKELIEVLFEHPYCRIQTLMDKLNIKTRQTAASYLNKLAEVDLLVMHKIGNEKIYFNTYFINELKDGYS